MSTESKEARFSDDKSLDSRYFLMVIDGKWLDSLMLWLQQKSQLKAKADLCTV